MKPKHITPYSLLLVLFAHVGILGAIVYAPAPPPTILMEPPAIIGAIVASEPIKEPEKPVPPPPEQKPIPKPKIPLPKAPPSERAVTQESDPVPTPPAELPVTDAPQVPVEPPRADASQLNNPAPAYPSQSRRLREEGVVLLEVLVKADGSLGELRLKKSSGFPRLDDSALRAVKNWHFMPAKRGGEAIDFWYELPIEFSLNH